MASLLADSLVADIRKEQNMGRNYYFQDKNQASTSHASWKQVQGRLQALAQTLREPDFAGVAAKYEAIAGKDRAR